jgi:uncharacterized membrane protein
MSKQRLEAFSDGVMAILITIMVLELKVPHGDGWDAIRPMIPAFLIFLGIYWNNHHHMLHAADRISGSVLWANLHLLFWLSLIPVLTGWLGVNSFATIPTALYGVVLFMSAVAYTILQYSLIHGQGSVSNSKLEAAIGRDIKGKLSLALYAAAIPMAFLDRWISVAIYVTVALMWLIPDPRIESKLPK